MARVRYRAMRLDLEGLDAQGVELAFDADASHPRRIRLGRTQKLSGMLTKTEDSLLLTDVQAEAVVVPLVELVLSSFSVQLGAEGSLRGLQGGMRREEATDVDVMAAVLDAPELCVRFSNFSVKGHLRGESVALRISGSEGQLEAGTVVVEGVEFEGDLSSRAERVVGQDLRVAWGADGYRVTLRSLELDGAHVGLDLREKSQEAGGEDKSRGSRSPVALFDWRTLDGLSGALDVDVHVNMKVPVIVTRRAKHPFRIQIREGTVNYMDLERSLSALEESILDFAVREGSLVLERGIPLIPTRGRGTPLVLWPLEERDLALTSEDRVRLAVLPRYERVEQESGGEEQGDSSVSLEELSLVDLQALLRLEVQETRGTASSLRALGFEELQLQGTVHHSPGKEPRQGEVTGKLRALCGSISGLFLGESQLDIGQLTLSALTDLRARFLDVRPEKVNFALSDLRLDSVSFGNLVEPPEGVIDS